jgi:hypothetical protein
MTASDARKVMGWCSRAGATDRTGFVVNEKTVKL